MGQRKALVFADVARFADYVRLGYPQARAQRGFTLYSVADPEHPRRTLLLLLGHAPRRFRMMEALSSLFSGASFDDVFQHVHVWEDLDAGTLSLKREGERDWTTLHIRERRHTEALIELISLAPVSDPQPPPVMLCLADSVSALRRLLLDSMALGNDRLALAAVGEQVLLRIESPSWFLIERTLDEGSIALFVPLPESGGRAWLPWGWRHPLGALWGRSEADAGEEWLLFQVGQRRIRLAPPRWQDVYDAADVVLDFSSTSTALAEAELTERFTVPVRLSPRARPAEPALWLVEADERAALERMLLSLDEADLEDLLIAPVQSSDGGPIRYFLRERRAGQGRQLLDAKARGFAPWQGLNDLFVPAELALEPRLRRDRYRQLFALGGGRLTVLAPPPGGGPVERLQIPSAAFAPLHRLVDFTLTAEAPRIEALQARSLFEFGTYGRATARPDLFKASPRSRTDRSETDPQSTPSKPTAAPTADAPAPEPATPARPDAPARPDRPLTALQQEERELERALIEEPTAERWTALQECKASLRKHDDAVICGLEAWWLTDARYTAEVREALLETVEAQLGLSGSPSARIRQLQAQPRAARSTLALAFSGHGLPPGQIPGWLAQAEGRLRDIAPQLSKKARWLAWGELWRHNRDVRSQARLRETILRELDTDGVSVQDIPPFIQERLLNDRSLEQSDASGESRQVLRNLQVLSEGLESLREPLRSGGQAALARVWRRAGRADMSTRALEAARRGSQPPLVMAWIEMQAAESSAPSEAEHRQEAYQRHCASLDRYTVEDLDRYAAALAARRADADLDAFLSADNVERLFPRLSRCGLPALEDPLQRMVTARQGNQRELFEAAARALLHAAIERLQHGGELIELSRLVFQAVREIAAFEKMTRQDTLTKVYQSAASKMVKQLHQQPAEYFAIMLQISLTRGLIELKQQGAGLRALSTAASRLSDAEDGPTLDLVDMSASLLRAIEGLPLDQRAPPIQQLLAAITKKVPKLLDLRTTGSTLQMLQLLDQLCEAAVSKDQLTLTRFRQYQDLDELLTRERVLREDFCI